ncbi:hypothetical protein ACWD4B_16685 [Streptomyces sp. NPDC002536]
MTADLSLLTTAAEKWDAAAKDFEKVQQAYDSQVKSIGDDGSWTGVANQFARPNMQQTHDQYSAAVKEARAVASLLRDAHAQFTNLRGKLKSAVAEAEKQNMKVGGDGRVRYTLRDDPTARHDPDYQTQIAKIAAAESSWAQQISGLVQAFDDADHGVKLALTAAVRDADFFDGTGGKGFNAGAEGDLRKVEVAEATRLAKRLNSGKHLDADELAEAQWLFRDVAQDTKSSQTFLDNIGPDGTIELTNKLNGLALSNDKARHQVYENMEAGLAGTVSTATANASSSFYDKWRDGLRKAGSKNFGSTRYPLYGYQSFVSLLEHHNHYGKQFLNDLGDDIIGTEKKEHGIWNQWRNRPGAESDPRWQSHPGIGNDPLDHLLGVMSKDPDAATSFLDPGIGGKNSRLQYLLHDRSWPTITLDVSGTHLTQDDPSNRAGLGSAIEAAATGREPNSAMGRPGPHTEEQARVMQQTIGTLDAGHQGDSLPANLRKPLGRALNDYVADTHDILHGQNGTQGSQHVRGAGKDSHIANSLASVTRVLRGVSDDDETYAMLYRSENSYSADILSQGIHHGDTSNEIGDWNHRATEVGKVRGVYNMIGADVIADKRDNKVTWVNDMTRYGYHGMGALANKIPVVGDEAQRLVDGLTYEWSKDAITEANNLARADNSANYASGIDGTYELIDMWADGRGMDRNATAVSRMRDEAEHGYTAGREAGFSALRPPV